MAITIDIKFIKIIIAGILFISLFFVKKRARFIIGLILTAYLAMIGANVI